VPLSSCFPAGRFAVKNNLAVLSSPIWGRQGGGYKKKPPFVLPFLSNTIKEKY